MEVTTDTDKMSDRKQTFMHFLVDWAEEGTRMVLRHSGI